MSNSVLDVLSGKLKIQFKTQFGQDAVNVWLHGGMPKGTVCDAIFHLPNPGWFQGNGITRIVVE